MSGRATGPEDGGATPSVQDQLAKLTSDLDHLKTESKGWVRTWGVYLGMLGALVALPKGILDLATQVWQSPKTSVTIKEITIYHDPGLSSEILQFPLVVTNAGNRDDVLLNHGATLTVASQSVEFPSKDFGLFDSDNGNKVDASLRVPKDEARAYKVAITFNSRTREVAATPGPHKLELRFLGGKDQSYVASFCFPLQDSQVHDLFESTEFTQQTMITECPDGR